MTKLFELQNEILLENFKNEMTQKDLHPTKKCFLAKALTKVKQGFTVDQDHRFVADQTNN